MRYLSYKVFIDVLILQKYLKLGGTLEECQVFYHLGFSFYPNAAAT